MMVPKTHKRMLITGISGLLGNNLAYCLKDTYDILGVYHSHKFTMNGIRTCRADLTRETDVSRIIQEFNPDIIVHGAAEADVEACEAHQSRAQAVNVLGTRNLIQNLNGQPQPVKFIYISTDLVYDGLNEDNPEEGPVHPLNFYGQTKVAAEQLVLKNNDVLVLRTNFFGWNVQEKFSLGELVIHELTRNKEMYGFTDCRFSSIYTFELARILDLAIQKDLKGIYNCASSNSMTKFDFVLEIAGRLRLQRSLIRPLSIDEFGFKAKRGKNLSLNTAKLAKDLQIDIPPITYSIERFVEDFNKGIPALIKANPIDLEYYPKSLDMIPYGRQCLDDDDIAAVVEVLKSISITQGPNVQEFESAVSKVVEAQFGVAVNSGTSGLHIACLAAGVGPGDEVITSANTFVASANCAVYCGGKPVFADIDSSTYNVSAVEIRKKLTPRTKAVIPVHFAGQSCDMAAIADMIHSHEKKFGHKIYIIEDACHALGSRYRDTVVGSCRYSDMAVMSFHPVKHITTGEGGMVLTNDAGLRQKLHYSRSHGITSDPEEWVNHQQAFTDGHVKNGGSIKNPWYYEQNCLGFNYRLTGIQSVLGLSQLNKLEKFRRRRRDIVNQYNEAFKGIDTLKLPFEAEFCESSFHLYVLLFDFERIGLSRAQVMTQLRHNGIQTQVHYIPAYTHPFFREHYATQWGDCPAAEQYYQKCLSIPLHPAMTQENVERVINGIKELVG